MRESFQTGSSVAHLSLERNVFEDRDKRVEVFGLQLQEPVVREGGMEGGWEGHGVGG